MDIMSGAMALAMPFETGNIALFLAVGSAAAILAGMAKGGFGGVAAMLSQPLMVYACGGSAFAANGILLPVLIICDWLSVGAWRWRWSGRDVWMMLPGSLAGVALGGAALWAMKSLDAANGRRLADAVLALAVGAMAIGFVAIDWRRRNGAENREDKNQNNIPFKPTITHYSAAGSAAGLVSTISQTSGPIIAMVLLPQRMTKERYVATQALYYWILNQIKLVPYFMLGMISLPSLGAGLLLIPAAAVGAVLGVFLHKRVSQRAFMAVIYVLLAITGAHLVWTSLLKLM